MSGGDSKNGVANSLTNQDLDEFLKLARVANNSVQPGQVNYGAEMKSIADKANLRFSTKSGVAASLILPVRVARNSQKRVQHQTRVNQNDLTPVRKGISSSAAKLPPAAPRR